MCDLKTSTLAALCVLTALLVLAPARVMAYGFGVSGTFASGSLQTEDYAIFGNGSSTAKYHETRYALGLLYDSNVARQRLFNYRLGIAYQDLNARSGDGKYRLKGVTFDHQFGFALYRTATSRWWVGPHVKVEFLKGRETHDGYRSNESVVGVGLGPVLGVNIGLGEQLSLALSGGYVFQSDLKLFSDWEERYGFVSVGLLYRLGRDAAAAAPITASPDQAP